ncbi:MAG: Hsp33 family molecular chaperone HslO [Lachnospiraceae bacterium]|nr:Hsp33 family molecular chaperone HslO [Lachnospiraceae bacterium]MCI9252108.1 Hsp33 family molecular chaperone HslO [Lachnospiraceae bacterium]MCI9479011.1 Hsp33 family molecular chaperone HslO [Lachnospiraceae bacterium]MCI9625130.1 Hsp33 family molecular chaperone HslO [Lachnospiraceae bacterium]GFI10741.1 33 kDa chaperonin [Lachnospiraceae bacterium]
MSDYIVRAAAADNQIRAFAITSREMVEKARQIHNTSPVATAALGRSLSAGAMMGSMMKGERDLLTLQIRGDGPLGGITVTADSRAQVKGYVNEPAVLIPANEKGKLDVSGAIGNGMLQVIRDLGMKEPYVGQTELQTGEIAEDLTYYFATSEQIPSSVGLGVLLNRDNTVCQAGGFIIQLMPYTEDKVIDALEQRLAGVSSVTELLNRGLTPEGILEELLGDLGLTVNDTIPTAFSCSCSKERVEKAIISIGSKEIREMIRDGKPIEVKCHFCNEAYSFQIEELKKILEKAKR